MNLRDCEKNVSGILLCCGFNLSCLFAPPPELDRMTSRVSSSNSSGHIFINSPNGSSLSSTVDNPLTDSKTDVDEGVFVVVVLLLLLLLLLFADDMNSFFDQLPRNEFESSP